jgi:hypothetical protein
MESLPLVSQNSVRFSMKPTPSLLDPTITPEDDDDDEGIALRRF